MLWTRSESWTTNENQIAHFRWKTKHRVTSGVLLDLLKLANLKMKVLHPRRTKAKSSHNDLDVFVGGLTFWIMMILLWSTNSLISQWFEWNNRDKIKEDFANKAQKRQKHSRCDEKFSLVYSFDITTEECGSKKWKCRHRRLFCALFLLEVFLCQALFFSSLPFKTISQKYFSSR